VRCELGLLSRGGITAGCSFCQDGVQWHLKCIGNVFSSAKSILNLNQYQVCLWSRW